MSTAENRPGAHAVQDLCRAISIALLLLHFYYYCYKAFLEWGLTTALTDHILDVIQQTGIFSQPAISKLSALAFLLLSLLGTRARKEGQFSIRTGLFFIASGLLLYFGSGFVLPEAASLYMGLTIIGYLLVLTGGVYLSRVIAERWARDFFRGGQGGLSQEERLIVNDFSINLPAVYLRGGRLRKSHINFINPRRGILIIGSPGSGKSWFIIEPAIRQLVEKGFSLFVYDFKYPVLTRLVYNLYLRHRDKYPAGVAFYSINFTDLSRSHRCNLLEPATMEYLSDAIGASRTILLSMNKTWVNRQGEFFVESPVNFLAALVWFLRKYKGGIYCTLPHAIELAQVPYDKLFTLLGAEPEIHSLINPFVEAYRNKTMEMLDSQVSSAKIPLGRLTSPDLYYILTGDDLSLDINNPAAPKILCLGGDPPRQEALAPILSLYIDRLNKLVNQQGKYKCAIVCDEFATIRAASLLTTIATARSNNIIPILAVQDLSQLRTQYSREEADLILNITGNLVCGQVGGDTARTVSERFPAVAGYKTTVSVNSRDTSFSRSELPAESVTASTMATLSSGEFVGIVADDPGRKLPLKAFHATIVRREPDTGKAPVELPVVREVTDSIVQGNFLRVKKEVRELVEEEMRRILRDPGLVGKVVKK